MHSHLADRLPPPAPKDDVVQGDEGQHIDQDHRYGHIEGLVGRVVVVLLCVNEKERHGAGREKQGEGDEDQMSRMKATMRSWRPA